MERNTGILLSGSLYFFATGYLLSPVFGWDLSSASVVAAFAGLPLFAQVGVKIALAWPFTFHLFNGIRYVVTAVGTQTMRSREQVVKIAWGVVGVSFVSALGLIAFY
jgi:succinate dehydrogenase (ubiquinone) cytochrome b560 subunit